MDERTYRALIAEAALEAVHPSVRKDVFQDADFMARLGVSVITTVKLGADGPSFRRDKLLAGFRAAIRAPGETLATTDEQDNEWDIRALEDESDGWDFTLGREDKLLHVSDHLALAEEASLRLEWLERIKPELMPTEQWIFELTEQLRMGALTDGSFADLMDDIDLMPASIEQSIRSELNRNMATQSLFSPTEARYYERLIGALPVGATVDDYIDGVTGPMIKYLVAQFGIKGFRQSLLLCSHARISSYLQLDDIDRDDLINTFKWLVERGDPISCTGAIEAAIGSVSTFPELEPYIEQIVRTLIVKPEMENDRYMLFEALFSMLSGDLARTHTLNEMPPFYRRQAAISQASLVIRVIADSRVEVEGLVGWIKGADYAETSFLQGLIDLRREPRWLPEYGMAPQLRAEVIGRLRAAVMQHGDNLGRASLRALMIGSESLLERAAAWPYPFLPGPLEGSPNSTIPLPKELLEQVRKSLESSELDANSFVAVINIAHVSGDAAKVSELVVNALHRVNYVVDMNDDESGRSLLSILIGLAVLAASSRSSDLAESIRVLSRVKRRRGSIQNDPEEEIRVVLIAAAAFEDQNDWAKFAGDWIAEIAFDLKDRARATNLQMMVRRLRQLEPALLPHVARAEAAFSALARQN
jgi:hypothetical protein